MHFLTFVGDISTFEYESFENALKYSAVWPRMLKFGVYFSLAQISKISNITIETITWSSQQPIRMKNQ